MDIYQSRGATSPSRPASRFWPRVGIGVLALVLLAATATAGLGWLPVGMLRESLEQRASKAIGARVTIGSLTRSTGFSFTPDITASDVRIAQPAWVPGGGDFVRLQRATVRLPLIPALLGRIRPQRLVVRGAAVALYRDANGRANWQRDRAPRRSTEQPSTITDLAIVASTLSLTDAKRGLAVAGPLALDGAHGLRWSARGAFLDTPARLDVTGGRVVGAAAGAPYPFVVTLASPALNLSATAVSDGVLNLRHFSADVRARAPTLKHLDRVIEAGLFGTQPIDLAATVRHDGREWKIVRIGGSIGRSRFAGRATIGKIGAGPDERTTITAALRASRLDFDDLADTRGRAAAAARRAALGERVVPPTRINLRKLGDVDGTVAFRIDRILSDSVFTTVRGNLTLDHRLLTLSNGVATFGNGRLTGTVRVDHRAGLPRLKLDLRASGATLGALLGAGAAADAPLRARIVLSGQGDTVRAAMSHADGKAALVATDGTILRAAADVLGQDLGGAIVHAIGRPSERVPLRCLVANFRPRDGVLTPSPLALAAGDTLGQGRGRIVLADETVALTITGARAHRGVLRIADPIRVGGTLTKPAISVADLPAGARPGLSGVVKVLGRSLGQALGIGPKAPIAAPPVAGLDCARASSAALR